MYVACTLRLKSGPLSHQREIRYRINDWNLNKGWLNLQLPQWHPYHHDRQQFVMFQFWCWYWKGQTCKNEESLSIVTAHWFDIWYLGPCCFWPKTLWIHTSSFYRSIYKMFKHSNIFCWVLAKLCCCNNNNFSITSVNSIGPYPKHRYRNLRAMPSRSSVYPCFHYWQDLFEQWTISQPVASSVKVFCLYCWGAVMLSIFILR